MKKHTSSTTLNGKDFINKTTFRERSKAYTRRPASFVILLLVSLSTLLTVVVLGFILFHILSNGLPYLKSSLFALNYNSENVSLFPSIITTLYMTALALLVSTPLGIFCSIYLVEYAKRGNKVVELIRLATETLAGIPSIVYGLFGLLFFVTALHWGYSLMAGTFTLAIMILPLIIRSTEEALKSVPETYREASFGLGTGKLRTVFKIALPAAAPGILAGVILAIGRIVGETAALIYTSGTVAQIPGSLLDSGRTMAIHMYALSSEGLHTGQAYATGVVLLIVVLILNTVSSIIAKKIAKV